MDTQKGHAIIPSSNDGAASMLRQSHFGQNLNPDINLTLADLQQFGDRTSHFATLYRPFQTFRLDPEIEGQIRYTSTSFAHIIGSEPLCDHVHRAKAYALFVQHSQKIKKECYMMPVSEKLAKDLEAQGFQTMQVGVEPIFSLHEIFSDGYSPLIQFSHARALAKREHHVREILPRDLNSGQKHQMESLYQEWISTRKSSPLGFLNTVDLWTFVEEKKIFVLCKDSQIKAFVLCTPIYPENSYFFSDYFREKNSKPGTMELLFVETMRFLYKSGIDQVRFGLCPFKGLLPKNFQTVEQRRAYQLMQYYGSNIKFPLNFDSLYRFKLKFNPSYLEPLYLVSNKKIGIKTLWATAQAHYPMGAGKKLFEKFKQDLKTYIPPGVRPRPWPENFQELLSRSSLTLSTSALFSLIHLGRLLIPGVNQFYREHGFTAGSYSLASHFWGPLFHNDWGHFLGDVSTYIFFVGALEVISGKLISSLVAGLGLWASNPMAWATLAVTLKQLAPHQYQKFLTEMDWGSSNAIYAAAGALAGHINRPRIILVPFIVNGLILTYGLGMWISIHHLLALFSGFLLVWGINRYKN